MGFVMGVEGVEGGGGGVKGSGERRCSSERGCVCV